MLIGHLDLSGVRSGVDLSMNTKKTCPQRRLDYPLCSKLVHFSRFNSQHNCRDLYDHLRNTRNLTSVMDKPFLLAPKIKVENDCRIDLDLLIISH